MKYLLLCAFALVLVYVEGAKIQCADTAECETFCQNDRNQTGVCDHHNNCHCHHMTSSGGSCSDNAGCTSNCNGNVGHCDHNGHCHCSHHGNGKRAVYCNNNSDCAAHCSPHSGHCNNNQCHCNH